MRREVWEEAGIRVGAVDILQSQPWPIGRSGSCELMIGCVARALTTDIAVNTTEMEDVRWFSRGEAKEMLDNSVSVSLQYLLTPSSGSLEEEERLFLPNERAIAHHLVQHFVQNVAPRSGASSISRRGVATVIASTAASGLAIGLLLGIILCKHFLLRIR